MMTRSSLVALMTVLAIGGSALGDSAPRGHDPDCGARALFQLIELTGKSASLDAIEKSLPTHKVDPRGDPA